MNVTWILVADSSGGLFSVLPSGAVTVSDAPGVSQSLDYFAFPNYFTLAVSATCVEDTSLVGRGTLVVTLNETIVAPSLDPATQVRGQLWVKLFFFRTG